MKVLKYIWIYVVVIAAMFFWSYSFIWYKDIYNFLPPFTTVLFRLTISSFILFSVGLLTRQIQRVEKKDYKLFLFLALSEPFFYFIGESLGMQYVTPTVGSVIISTIPLFVPFFAFFLLKEKVSVKNIVGIMISFFGVSLVLFDKNMELVVSMKGIMLLGLAVVSAVSYTIVLKKLAHNYNSITLISWQNTIGAILFLPLVLVFDHKHFAGLDFTSGMWEPLLKLSIFASSLAFLGYTYGIKFLGAVKANIFTNMIPVFTAFIYFFRTLEIPPLYNRIGILLVVAGLVLTQIRPLETFRANLKNGKKDGLSND